jgi:hypothetical protein
VLYGAGVLLFPPSVVLNSDEALYIRQAVAYAAGHTSVEVRNPETWEVSRVLPSSYPPGTSLLQAPFVRAGGWTAACWASVLALGVVLFVTAAWLRRLELRPTFAALIPMFLPVAVLGRTGMSDLPGAAVVVSALFLLARAPDAKPIAGGGFLAGLSVAFRDSNLIFIVPTILKCVLRRERVIFLAAAGVLGVSVRLGLAALLQGDALTVRAPYVFTLSGAAGRAVLYGFALTVLVPGGLVAVSLYRGPGRALMLTSVGAPFLFFTLYSYSGQSSGFLGSLVLGPRYIIPLVPLAAIALASLVEHHVPQEKQKQWLELAILAAAAIVTCLVHPVLHAWSERQSTLVRALYDQTSPEATLVTEPGATAKYLNGLYGQRVLTDRLLYPPEKLRQLLAHGPVQLVFIDRGDSEYWRALAKMNEQYLTSVAESCELKLRVDLTSIDRLRVVDVVECH